jgi:hypothetical protein
MTPAVHQLLKPQMILDAHGALHAVLAALTVLSALQCLPHLPVFLPATQQYPF